MAPIKLENHIREQLQEREIKTSNNSWEKLQQQLDSTSKKKNNKGWFYLAASIVGIIIISSLLLNKQQVITEPSNNIVEVNDKEDKIEFDSKVLVSGEETKIDDTSEPINQKEIKASLELKFKTKLQGAQDFGRIDSYVDIEALEQSLERGYITGRFFMITDSTAYINKSKKGVGTIFAMHKEHMSKPGIFQSKVCKGRENVMIELKDTYKFDWEYLRNFYFLELKINK